MTVPSPQTRCHTPAPGATVADFDGICRSDLLQRQLELSYPPSSGSHVVVAVQGPAGETRAAINEDSARFSVPAGCLAKLLTATLLRRLTRGRGLSFESPVLAVLEQADPQLRAMLAGITFRHLLDHAHGLDGSELDAVPRDSNGFVDRRALLSVLERAPRLGAPGEVCSYGDAGAWLSAWVLEYSSGRRFEELLDQVLSSWSSANESGVAAGICPALGGGLRIPMASLLAYLRSELSCGPSGLLADTEAAALESSLHPRSGWSALDQGLYLGWTYYGAGWLGHNSIVPHAPAMVRINPGRGLALLVSTDGTNPTMVAARLFSRMAPELFRINTPASGNAPRLPASALDACQGRYGIRRVSFELLREEHSMTISAYARVSGDGEGPYARGVFVPGHRNVLIARAAHPLLPQFFQLIHPVSDGFRFLWDGKSAFPRLQTS